MAEKNQKNKYSFNGNGAVLADIIFVKFIMLGKTAPQDVKRNSAAMKKIIKTLLYMRYNRILAHICVEFNMLADAQKQNAAFKQPIKSLRQIPNIYK